MVAPAIPFVVLAEKAAEAIVGLAIGVGIYKGGEALVNEMSKADEEAEKRPATGAIDEVCSTCEQENPCRHLERGTGDGPYRGGSYRGVSVPRGDELDAHHTPADAATPLSKYDGPAIQMEPPDHWRTASNGRTPGHAAYIVAQRSMINSGNFLGATELDTAEIRVKFGSKYDEAIAEMEAYTACLKANGIVQ